MGRMRLAWYAGVSTALAAGVVVSAFNQRPNFYSACVYLAQSNLCLMILINLILFLYGSFVYGLQRLCYGPLRPIETEQLYEKAWFAVTETCLAMTIFREEVGAWFLVMFVALLTGKVWGWIGEGRVEVLEQQPPANPRLFHFRLSVSLALSVIYDLWLMSYTVNTVIQQARPNMMVMFLFEFAVLAISSWSTAFRYCISLREAAVIKKQTQERLAERRREVREEREQTIREREAEAAAARERGETPEPINTDDLPTEDSVEEMDIEVPGWESKGQWILTLDLITDFARLGIYSVFFFVLLTFYGLPIHIMRDLFLTARSFVKRLTAFLRYRRATQDMNRRYEDATVEDIEREDTCIICREIMRPWSVTNPPAPEGAPGQIPPARRTTTVNERSRPKKLPCGHILHLGCLKSWLERQQVCPTCRRPVVETPAQAAAAARAAQGAQGAGPQGNQAPGNQDPGIPPVPPPGGALRGMRMLNIGPLRVGFGQAPLQDLAQGFAGRQDVQQNGAPGPRVYGFELGFPRRPQPPPQGQQGQQGQPLPTPTINGSQSIRDQLQSIEDQLTQEIQNLQLAQNELTVIRTLQAELMRIRANQLFGNASNGNVNTPMPPMPQALNTLPSLSQPSYNRTSAPLPVHVPMVQRHSARPNTTVIPAGSADLPPGVIIPEGWSLLPLQRVDMLPPGIIPGANIPPPGVPSTSTGGQMTLAPTVTGQPSTSPTNPESSNNTTPIPAVRSHILTSEPSNSYSSHDSSMTNASRSQPSATTVQGQTTPSTSASNTTTTISSTTTSRNGNTVTETSETLAPTPTTASAALPNWGSSQLFSGTSLGGNGSIGGGSSNYSRNDSSSTPTPPLEIPSVADNGVVSRPAPIPASASASGLSPQPAGASDEDSSESESDSEGSDEESVRKVDKGKGKAATVEDADDDESNNSDE
ncbi:hypothetical protein F5884DRAFT_828927 [Xylogone sp. PMI_703]|nr:hypothetical protein F5884DRAFT_828927 [Xylogone sp. PMI_703]